MLLALASGAGLLAFGVTSLWRALHDSEERARRTATQAAVATARAVREALRDPSTLELVPEVRRFLVADGQVVVPEWLGALRPEAERPRTDLPPAWRGWLLRLESGAEPAAVPQFPLSRRAEEWVTSYRAWRDLRDDDTRQAASRLVRLLESLRSPDRAAPPFRSVLAGVMTLHATLRGGLPADADGWLRRLTVVELRGLRERLRELGCAADADRALAVERDVRTRRAVLQSAAEHLPILLSGPSSHAIPVGAGLLLFWRDVEASEGGRGAVAEPLAVAARLQNDANRLLLAPWSGFPRAHPLPADNAIEVVPGSLDIVPDYGSGGGAAGWAGPVGLWLLLGACAACFVVGLFATVRVMSREAAAVRARADFLTSVTHELKTPLASIRLLAERLHEGRVADAPRQREYYGLLAGESARLTVLIENVLDLGRIERGERAYDMRRVELGEVVAEALGVVRPLFTADGLELCEDVQSGRVAVTADRGAIVQALVNVLDNARKYGRTGGDSVEVSVGREADRAVVSVRDRGPGVPAAEREAIFERFERGVAQRDGSVPGVGLGLYLAREILRAHRGDLTCGGPDDDDRGTVFRFTLPIVEEPVS